jgi:hypothetical protein
LASYSRMAAGGRRTVVVDLLIIGGECGCGECDKVIIQGKGRNEQKEEKERSARAPLALARNQSARIKKTTRPSCRFSTSVEIRGSRSSFPLYRTAESDLFEIPSCSSIHAHSTPTRTLSHNILAPKLPNLERPVTRPKARPSLLTFSRHLESHRKR